jgi:hypothetical protein
MKKPAEESHLRGLSFERAWLSATLPLNRGRADYDASPNTPSVHWRRGRGNSGGPCECRPPTPGKRHSPADFIGDNHRGRGRIFVPRSR